MTVLDERLLTENKVLRRNGDGDAMDLVVDTAHPFYFDHPLDHVPGLLLLEAAVQAAQARAAGPCFVSRIDAAFIKFALLSAPVRVTCRAAQSDSAQAFGVELFQDGRRRARVAVRLCACGGATFPHRHAAAAETRRPCDGAMINKRNPQNRLITTPESTAGGLTTMLLPPQPSCLMSDSRAAVHPLYLLEGFMQLERYRNNSTDNPARIRDILAGVSLHLAAPVLDRNQAIEIRGEADTGKPGARHTSRSARLFSNGRLIADCELRTAIARSPC